MERLDEKSILKEASTVVLAESDKSVNHFTPMIG